MLYGKQFLLVESKTCLTFITVRKLHLKSMVLLFNLILSTYCLLELARQLKIAFNILSNLEFNVLVLSQGTEVF